MPIKHAFTSGKADGGDATLVQPSNWNADHTIDTHLDLPAIATPATPSSGTMRMWGKQRAGRIIPCSLSPDGAQHTMQEALFSNHVQWMKPNTGTTVPLEFGNTWTGRASTGTLSTPTPALTNHYTSMRRMEFTSGAVAAQGYGIQGAMALNYLGNAANRGGFFYFCRFGFSAYTSAARVFIGLTTQNAAYGATEPSTVNNTVGRLKDSTDGTCSFAMRGTAVTKNGTFTPANNTIYDFTMSCAPNSTTVYYRLVDETNGTVIWDNLSTSTNAPAVNTLLYVWAWVGASSAVSQIMGINKIYVASDF